MTAQQLLTETFNNKETYLAWRADWRKVYAQLSADIRLSKQVRNDNQRNPAINWDAAKNTWVRSRPWTQEEEERQQKWQGNSESYPKSIGLAPLATKLMARRMWSKEEAQRQYLASRMATA